MRSAHGVKADVLPVMSSGDITLSAGKFSGLFSHSFRQVRIALASEAFTTYLGIKTAPCQLFHTKFN